MNLPSKSLSLNKGDSMPFLLKIFFAIFLFVSVSNDLFAVAFRARIYSRVNAKGEANLNIFVFETNKFYKTDADGYFDADVPTLGTYTIRILRATGMQELKKAITVDGEVVTLYTDKVESSKGALLVEGKKDKTILSRYKVRYDEIKRMPGTLGEALNSLQTLPGIFAPPFSFGNIVIRGSSPESNTYLYDDLPIFYAFHFDSINSVIHNDLIKTIDVYTGAYPANFANATGGVIEIESTDTVKKNTGQASFSVILGQVMYQSPIFNGKGYVAAGGKVGYMDKTIGQTSLIPEGIRLPQYTSSNFKLVYNFTDQHQLSFTNLTAHDSFVLNLPTKRKNDPTREQFPTLAGASVAATRGFRTTALRYIWTPGDKFSNRITLINYKPYVQSNVKVGSIESDFIAGGPYMGVRQDAKWTIFQGVSIDFGSEYRRFYYNVNGYSVKLKDPLNSNPNPFDTLDPDFEKAEITQKNTMDYGNAYSTIHLQFGGLKLEPGVRYDRVQNSSQGVLGPRMVASYKLDGLLSGTTFFGGAGDYFRYPFFDEVLSKETGNPNIKFEKARKYGGGIEQGINEDWVVKAEIFKQEFSDLIVNDPYITDPVGLNPDRRKIVETPLVYNKSLSYSNKGDGWSQGYEVFLKKSNKPSSRDWFGWVSYTWSQTYRNDNLYKPLFDEDKKKILTGSESRFAASVYNNSKEIIYQYDITHIFNVVYGWRFNETWQIGGRWIYRTAYPFTPVTGDDGGQFKNQANGQTFWNPKYSDNPYSADYKNSRRAPPYHRLDIRIDKFLNYEWGFMNVYIEVMNLYARRNVIQENFNTSKPYSNTNPSTQTDFFTLRTPQFILPFFNFGLEVRF